jgi:IS5 family transposase
MSSPRLTTVLLPPAKGTSIGDNRVASPPGREAGRAGATTKLGKIRSPQMGSIQRPLTILKHMHDLSDEVLCERWVENPYYQLFCGEEFFQHRLVFDRSSLTRWRQRTGEDKLAALVPESLASAIRMGAARPADFTRVIVDTTVQEKASASRRTQD